VPEGGKVSAEQTERARMLPKSQTHSDTHPACQRHRIAVLSCFILPGLPSQALTRQLSQRESPWQRGFVFDETDWGLLENVTECQSLSLWERWHGEAVTERARMLTKSQTHSDTSAVCQRHRIAVLSCFILPGLPSQALVRQLSWQESPWQRGVVFDETDLRLLKNVTECQSLSCQERWHRAKRRCRRGCTEQHLRYPAHSKGVLCPTSQSRIRSTALLAGEPLAKRFRFR